MLFPRPLVFVCLRLLALLWLHALAVVVQAGETAPLRLTADRQEYLLGPHLSAFEDPDGRMGFDEVRASSSRFQPVGRDVPNFGVTRSAWWLQGRIVNVDADSARWMLGHPDAMYQSLDIWIIRDSGQVMHYVAGSLNSRSAKAVGTRGHVFELGIAPGEGVEIYIRGVTGYVQFAPLFLWQPVRFAEVQALESMWHGVYFGIVAAMILYNLFVYRTFRESVYLYYVGYMASFMVVEACLNGTMAAYVLPQHPVVVNLVFTSTYVMGALASTAFSYRFLRVDRVDRAFMGVCVVLFTVTVVAGVTAGYSAWSRSYQIAVGILSTGLLMVGVKHVLRGDKPARYYLAGYGWFLASSLLLLMMTVGVIEFSLPGYFAVEIGSAMEAMLLSLALAQRVREMKDEKEHAQLALLESNQKAAEAARQYSRRLEEDVRERTAELVAAQQKLVAHEKSAALGVFTAGMAHEINNPANFATVGAQNAAAQLSVFRSFVGDLLEEEADPDIKNAFDTHFRKLTDSMETINEGISRIGNVVSTLRATHPEGATGRQPTDVVSVLQSAWRVLSPTVNVSVIVRENLDARAVVSCRVADMHQVFLAILGNAVDAIEDMMAMKPEKTSGMILLTSQVYAGALVISITDDGPGIPTAIIDKIFDPFFTTKTVGRGAGLGLSMARDVMRVHGGTLVATSDEGRGATFELTFPDVIPKPAS